jgi:hypothetical protein
MSAYIVANERTFVNAAAAKKKAALVRVAALSVFLHKQLFHLMNKKWIFGILNVGMHHLVFA